jgi:hypothetical protein
MIRIEITNADKFKAALKRFQVDTRWALTAAGLEAARAILDTRGLRAYPPATAANKPGRTKQVTFKGGKTATFRMPYYVRGNGTFSPVRGGGYKFEGNSQRYGTQFYPAKNATSLPDPYHVVIGNRASYASYLGGDDQVGWAGRIGWKKLSDVAREKVTEITRIYNTWIEILIKKVGL